MQGPAPLDPSDDAGIKTAVRTFMGLTAPIEKVGEDQESACEDQTSTFFRIVFSVTPRNTPGNATADWKRLATESIASYLRKNCAEGVLVQAEHDNTLRLEVAIRFSGQGRDGKNVRYYLRKTTLIRNLPGSPKD